MFTIEGKYTTAVVYADQVEPSCVAQITGMVNNAAFTGPVAIMPDTHAGAGSVIGFTMPLGEALPPAIVGVDVGCGVLAARVPWRGGISLERLDREIRARVPFAMNVREDSVHELGDRERDFAGVQALVWGAQPRLRERFPGVPVEAPPVSYRWLLERCREIGMDFGRAQRSIGTLGGGNHFVEVGVGADPGTAWVLVHSGSRQFGEKVCKYHAKVAERNLVDFRKGEYQAEIEAIRRGAPRQEIDARIRAYKAQQRALVAVPRGLEPLRGADLVAYLWDMIVAQWYAVRNRVAILHEVVDALDGDVLEVVETVHNYIDPVDFMIRKGAVRAARDARLVIPFNMRDGSWVCRGLGNAAWNESAPHGAGRLMSRTQAKRELDPVAARASMAGIYTSCIPLDEAP
jgi:tRNA-splicing ligase RtcB (3'-phosphate/5'-hydroxy nucleic acid ligase)